MSRSTKYTLSQLVSEFPTEEACLKWLVEYHHPKGIVCPVCKKKTKHYKVSGRRAYACANCGHHFYPTAGTIFHGSRTPLTDWFKAIYLMSSNKAGTSAKTIERTLGVTYKTAWRMLHQIRLMMGNDDTKLSGEVELDELIMALASITEKTATRRTSKMFGHT
ncbi:MAG: IS1595 family transposase [Candidatus Saccharimonadales bacterium]